MATHTRLALLLLLPLTFTLSGCESGHTEAETYVHRVQAVTLEEQNSYDVRRQYAGRVEAKQRVDLGFELAGTVAEVLVDSGDTVEAGELLVRLDSKLLEDEKSQLLASRDELEAQRELVLLEIKRQKKLRNQGFTAEQRMDELEAESKVLAAQLKRQEALLAALDTRLAKSELRAAYRADISRRYLDQGAVVSPGTAVLQLLEKGNLQAVVGVPPTQTAALNAEQPVLVNYGGGEINAKLLSVGRAVDPVTRTVDLKLALPAETVAVDGDIMFLWLQETREQKGYWLPASSLLGTVRGMWNVMSLVPVEQSDRFRLELRSVEILHRQRDQVYVRGALSSGEQVVAAGIHRLAPGQMVRTQEAEI